MPGRCNAEGGEKEKESEEEVRKIDNEVMNAILTSGPIESAARSDIAAVVQEKLSGRGSSCDAAEEPFQHVRQSWGCSQNEDEVEQQDAMDCLADDEMRRPWREVSQEEERITRRRSECRECTVERLQSVPELVVTQLEEKKVAGWRRRRRWQVRTRFRDVQHAIIMATV